MFSRSIPFVYVGNSRNLGYSRRRRVRLMHVTPWRMKWMMCFKGCISGCVVKSSGVWEETLAFTSRLPPSACSTAWPHTTLSTHVLHAVSSFLSFVEWLVNSRFLCLDATATSFVLIKEGKLYSCTWPHGGWGEWCISRGASPDVRWSPLVFGKRHLHSHPDFLQEACSTVSPHTTFPHTSDMLLLVCESS
jgi:hypothetical protein